MLAEHCQNNVMLLQLSDLKCHCICVQEAEPGPMDCRSLVEEEAVDVNLRDAWDAVPLYYACRSGMQLQHCDTLLHEMIPRKCIQNPIMLLCA